ncbi:bifunctional 3'-5' exonuclease/DNA polymerase [Sediminihabitans luteus]|uniref:bifunctional 3'-5' exonuclease/DNA polymerase n=1 Tax=Sediminihabitans luteus TaxID=1138585 RepID=UPI003570BC19
MLVAPGGGPGDQDARLAAVVRDLEADRPRWVWHDTTRWYPRLLAAGVRVERCHDLRLARRILRASAWTARSAWAAQEPGPWDALEPLLPDAVPATPAPDALFDIDVPRDVPAELDPVAELRAQLDVLATASGEPGASARLRLLVAAESAGALVAAEIRHAGLPWDAAVHDAILTDALGPRPRLGVRPARLEALAVRIRDALDAPDLNPDSAPHLLRALGYAGVPVTSTRQWELESVDHPVVAPLLEYKKLYRLYTANGWSWLDAWVHDGRFRPDYVVGGVVTGRWATSGGGALQLPHGVRRAVVADPGWVLVVADAAQLEPRVLAGLAHDERMARAGRGGDLYQGMVDAGAVATRDEAKIGVLGAMYGGTTGQSAVLRPRLAAAYPDAVALVDAAARTGEAGDVVTTRLGRTSPRPGDEWQASQSGAFDESATAADESRARTTTRAWGRFTRNFVVQGTAAEWALCWLATLRGRLHALAPADAAGAAPAPFGRTPHLVYFLHDEVVVHAPAALADDVAAVLRESAAEAGRLLFGAFGVDFPVTVATVESYADAK